jgi:hypothetical protein
MIPSAVCRKARATPFSFASSLGKTDGPAIHSSWRVDYDQDGYVVIGLVDARVIDLLRLEWPSGVVQEFSNVPVKQTLEIVEPIQVAAAEIPLLGPGTGGLRLMGATSRPLHVDGSSDLVHWSAVEVVGQHGNGFNFMDHAGIVAGNEEGVVLAAPYRFYRVWVP